MFTKLHNLISSTHVRNMNLKLTSGCNGELEVLISCNLDEGVEPKSDELKNQMNALIQPIRISAKPDELDEGFAEFLEKYVREFKKNSNSFASALDAYSKNNSNAVQGCSKSKKVEQAKEEVSNSVLSKSAPTSL